jgi:beta-N-acetylhexosaminidase
MRLSSDPAARRRLAALAGAGAVALFAGIAVGSGTDEDGAARPRSPQAVAEERTRAAVEQLSLRQQVGQVTISSFPDRAPPAYLRRRLRAGETAGVILFGLNADSREDWLRLTRAIQRPAGRSALIMVDQEGGEIRAVGWAGPPTAQPLQGDPSGVRRAARDAARQLAGSGVNVNLAPVADVAAGPASVMATRAFTGDARAVAARAGAAVEGMSAAGVAATAKHFPGLGRARVNTDDASASVPGGLDAELAPFRAAIDAEVPLVMLSHALYPALDQRRIASQSRPIISGLLREQLDYRGVIVTDSIEAQAVLDRSGVGRAAERSIGAGADLILMTGSASWNEVHPWLLRRARASPRLRERIRRSAARVLALKERLDLP